MRGRVEHACVAAGLWVLCWAILSLGIGIGVEGKPDPSFAIQMMGYGGATGLIYGGLVFFGWWQVLPLWLRGALYGVLAAAPVLAAILVFGFAYQTLDWWKLTAAWMISGLQGYLLREALEIG